MTVRFARDQDFFQASVISSVLYVMSLRHLLQPPLFPSLSAHSTVHTKGYVEIKAKVVIKNVATLVLQISSESESIWDVKDE